MLLHFSVNFHNEKSRCTPLSGFLFVRRQILLSPSYFSLSPCKFSLCYKIFFVTNFVTRITKFVTCVRKFVTAVTKFVIKNILAGRKKYLGDNKNFQGARKHFQAARAAFRERSSVRNGAWFCAESSFFYFIRIFCLQSCAYHISKSLSLQSEHQEKPQILYILYIIWG